MSRLMGKPTICICKTKGADQLYGNREADQHLCFHYSDSTIPPLLNSKISSVKPSSVMVQAGFCWTWSETTLLVFPRGGSYCCALIISGLVGLSPFGCLLITSLTFVIYEAASNVMITLNHKFHIPS